MPNRFITQKNIIALACLAVFLLALIILPKEAKAQVIGPGTTCCVTTNGVCAPPNERENCPSGSDTYYYPCRSLGNKCKVYVSDVSQLTLPTPETKPEAVKKPLKFIPNITIPGSKFITGQEVTIDGDTLGDWIAAFYIFFCGVAGILAAVMIMWGGYKYVTSFGNPQRISDAKDNISSALIGLVLSLGAYVILLTINPNLVKFKSLKLPTIQPIYLSEQAESSMKGAPPVTWDGKNVDKYDDTLLIVAILNQVNRNWLKALMLVESGGDPNAVSRDANGNVLACGLIQLLPSTANMTCEELKDPDTNIMAAAQYYRSLLTGTCPTVAYTKSGKEVKCDLPTNCKVGDPKYMNAAYNGGPGANCSSHDEACENQTWWECQNLPGFAETRAYVQKVQQAYDKIIENGW